MLKFYAISVSILSLIFTTGFSYLVYQETKYKKPNHIAITTFADNITFPKTFIKEVKLKDILSVENKNVRYHGWIPTWALEAGLKSLEENKSKFATVSPVLYLIKEDGSIETSTTSVDKIKNTIKNTEIKLIPTISSFDPDGLRINLANMETYNSFLLEQVDKFDFDGIDLNYELIYQEDKELFFDHIKKLSEELRNRGKVLYVTVLSKWGDSIEYGFASQTRNVHDYSRIAQYAQQIRIMTYDFTSQGSGKPGPIAPIEWVERVLTYAVNRVDPEKIALGIHLYGYFWSPGQNTIALDYRDISQIRNLYTDPDYFFSSKHQEAALLYTDSNGKTYFGYYSDPQTIKARIELAATFGVQNVVFWRLGDDPL